LLNKTLKLYHCRFKAKGEFAENPKALIFYVHGYGDYSSRYAYVGEFLSERGYEFVALDQRGFGNSEGVEGKIESYEINADDNAKFHQAYVQFFHHLSDTPKFLLSGSFGAQIILYNYVSNPSFYTGLIFGAPYFRHKEEEEQRKALPALTAMAAVMGREHKINFGYDTRQK